LPGALLVLAKYPLYALQSVGAAAWELTPLQDQQLAGVIMWVPAGLAYVLAIAWLIAKWMEHAELEEIKRSGRFARASLLIVPLLLACGSQAHAQGRISAAGGDASHGAALMRQFGCGSCHVIRGVSGADGMVGPPLNDIANRIYVAGMLRNTPDNMVRWLMYPQQVVPGNAMPDMGITFKQARDMTAYLYTLR
jgi:putative membrane protein